MNKQAPASNEIINAIKEKMKTIKASNEHAGDMAKIYASAVQKASQANKLEYTYPHSAQVSAHDALQTWAYKIGEIGYFYMFSSFGSAILSISPKGLIERTEHPRSF